MIVKTVADLHAVSNCPMGETCENCGSEFELNIETVETKVMGVFCLTLCDECTEFERMPKMTPVMVTHAVLQHCGHLEITADRMDQLMTEGEKQ